MDGEIAWVYCVCNLKSEDMRCFELQYLLTYIIILLLFHFVFTIALFTICLLGIAAPSILNYLSCSQIKGPPQ